MSSRDGAAEDENQVSRSMRVHNWLLGQPSGEQDSTDSNASELHAEYCVNELSRSHMSMTSGSFSNSELLEQPPVQLRLHRRAVASAPAVLNSSRISSCLFKVTLWFETTVYRFLRVVHMLHQRSRGIGTRRGILKNVGTTSLRFKTPHAESTTRRVRIAASDTSADVDLRSDIGLWSSRASSALTNEFEKEPPSLNGEGTSFKAALSQLAAQLYFIGAAWPMLRAAFFVLELYQFPLRISLFFHDPKPIDIFIDCAVLVDTLVTLLHRSWIDFSEGQNNGSFARFRQYIQHPGALAATSTLLPYFVLPANNGIAYQAVSLPKAERIFRLYNFFLQRERNLSASIRVTACFKFVLVLFGIAHFIGQALLFSSMLYGFPEEPSNQTWVTQFTQTQFSKYDPGNASAAQTVAITLFKGFSTLAAVAFVDTVPRNLAEIVLFVLSFYVTLMMVAYVLGMLFNFLIIEDDNIIHFRKRLHDVEVYAEERSLDSQLTQRLREELIFMNKRHSTGNFLRQLQSQNLQARTSRWVYDWVTTHNCRLFSRTTDEFKQEILSSLHEIAIEPGAAVALQEEVAHEVFFVTGTGSKLELLRDDFVLQECMPGDYAAADVFLVGMRHFYTIRSSTETDSRLLVLSRSRYDTISDKYPDQAAQLLSNILATYGLKKDGTDLEGTRHVVLDASDDEQGKDFVYRRNIISDALTKRTRLNFDAASDAACRGDVESCKSIIAKSHLPYTAANHDNRTMLHLASKFGSLNVVNELLQNAEETVNALDRFGKSPLQVAVDFGSYSVQDELRKKGGVLSLPFKGETMCNAAWLGNSQRLSDLIKNGISPDEIDKDGRSALMVAAAYGHLECMQVLLSNNASSNLTDRLGNTALDETIKSTHDLCAHTLATSAKAKMHIGFKSSRLCACAANGRLRELRLLLKNGANVDERDVDGRTPVQLAAFHGNLLIVVELFFRGAHLSIRDRWRITPLSSAARSKKGVIAQLLQCNGAVVDAMDTRKDTIHTFIRSDAMPPIHQAHHQYRMVATLAKTIQDGYGIANEYDAARTTHRASLELIKHADEVHQAVDETSELLGKLVDAFGDDTDEDIQSREVHSLYGIMQLATGLTVKKTTKAMESRAATHEVESDEDIELRAASLNKVFAKVASLDVQLALEEFSKQLAVFYGHDLTEQVNNLLTSLATSEDDAKELLSQFRDDVLTEALQMKNREDVPNLQLQLHEVLVNRHFFQALKVALQGKFRTNYAQKEPQRDIMSETVLRGILKGSQGLLEAFDSFGSSKEYIQETDIIDLHSRLSALGLTALLSRLYSELQRAHALSFPGVFPERIAEAILITIGLREEEQEVSDIAARPASHPHGFQCSSYKADVGDEATFGRSNNHTSPVSQHNEGKSKTHEFNLCLKSFRTSALRRYWYYLLISRAGRNLDKNGNGYVNRLDIEQLVRRCSGGTNQYLPHALENLQSLLDKYADDDGQISVQVFIKKATSLALAGRKENGDSLGPLLQPSRMLNASQQKTVLGPGVSRWVISPGSKLYEAWSCFSIYGLSVWYLFDVPFRIAFETLQRSPIGYMVVWILFDVLFLADISLVQPRVAFYNENGILITHPIAILRRYLAERFPLDILTVAPVEYIIWATSAAVNAPPPYRLMAWVRLVRLLRMIRLFQHLRLSSFASSLRKQNLSRRLLHLLIPLLAITHICTCVFFFTSRIELERGNDTWINLFSGFGKDVGTFGQQGTIMEQYAVSFYYISTILSSHGLVGNAKPANYTELVMLIPVLVIALAFGQYIIGSLSQYIHSSNAQLMAFRRSNQQAEQFIQNANLPNSLAKEVRQAMKHHGQLEDRAQSDANASSGTEIVQKLSHSVQVQVAKALNRGVLDSAPLLQGTSSAFRAQLSIELEERWLESGTVLFNFNSFVGELYFVKSGYVEVCLQAAARSSDRIDTHEEDGYAVNEQIGPGETVGELSFLFEMRHDQCARIPGGSGGSVLFALKRNQLKLLQRFYEDDVELVEKNAIRRFEQAAGQADDAAEARVSGASSTRPSTTSASKGRTSGSQFGLESQSDRTSGHPSGLGAQDRKRKFGVLEEMKKQKKIEKQNQLLVAVSENELDSVKRRLQSDADAGEPCETCQQTPLLVAAREGHLGIVKELVEQWNVSLDYIDPENGFTALGAALHFLHLRKRRFEWNRHDDVIEYLVSKGATVEMDMAASTLIRAAADDDNVHLRRMVYAGIDVNLRNYHGRTALHAAATAGSEEVVRSICCMEGAYLSLEDNDHHTPLVNAIGAGHLRLQQVLRSAGGNLGSKDRSAELNDLANRNRAFSLSQLYNNGADLNSRDHSSRTPLAVAAANNCIETASLLCSLEEVQLNPVDSNGCTPLDEAQHQGNTVIVSLLNEKGALSACDNRMKDSLAREHVLTKQRIEAQQKGIIERASMESTELKAGRACKRLLPQLREHSASYSKLLSKLVDTLSRMMILYRYSGTVTEEHFEASLSQLGDELKQDANSIQDCLTALHTKLEQVERCHVSRVPLLRMKSAKLDEMASHARKLTRKAKSMLPNAIRRGQHASYAFKIFDQAAKAEISTPNFQRKLLSGAEVMTTDTRVPRSKRLSELKSHDEERWWIPGKTVAVVTVTDLKDERNTSPQNRIGLAVANKLWTQMQMIVVLAAPTMEEAQAAKKYVQDVDGSIEASERLEQLIPAECGCSNESIASFSHWLRSQFSGCEILINAATYRSVTHHGHQKEMDMNARWRIRLVHELVENEHLMPRHDVSKQARILSLVTPQAKLSSVKHDRMKREMMQWAACADDLLQIVNCFERLTATASPEGHALEDISNYAFSQLVVSLAMRTLDKWLGKKRHRQIGGDNAESSQAADDESHFHDKNPVDGKIVQGSISCAAITVPEKGAEDADLRKAENDVLHAIRRAPQNHESDYKGRGDVRGDLL